MSNEIIYTLTTEARRAACVRAIMALPLDDLRPPVECVLRPEKVSKTWAQLRMVHGWFNEIAAYTGDDPVSVKADMKESYGLMIGSFTKRIKVEGQVIPLEINIQKSLADYSLEEMMGFMDRVQRHASDRDMRLTQPLNQLH